MTPFTFVATLFMGDAMKSLFALMCVLVFSVSTAAHAVDTDEKKSSDEAEMGWRYCLEWCEIYLCAIACR